jgi:hypothetical protein
MACELPRFFQPRRQLSPTEWNQLPVSIPRLSQAQAAWKLDCEMNIEYKQRSTSRYCVFLDCPR